VLRDGAGKAGTGEYRQADRGRATWTDSPRQVSGRDRRQRHHQVEGDEHPGDAGDAGVELAVDLRQGKDDDRGVGQYQADGDRQRRDAGSGSLGVQ
jgi:hypothetical protein